MNDMGEGLAPTQGVGTNQLRHGINKALYCACLQSGINYDIHDSLENRSW